MIPSTLFCDNCGAANRAFSSYCRMCGHVMRPPQPAVYHSTTGRLLAGVLLKQRYRILTALGSGGMGSVYEAQDTQLGDRQIALKEMNQPNLNAQEQQEAASAFRQEAIMLARLQHPNLPSIFDHFEENGRWYLVMSFIEGETLEEYLAHVPGGRLPAQDVIQIGIALCGVLGYLHNQQPAIIFRDLKPANIMRTPEEHLYLIDFGIARHFKPGQARDTSYYGSMGYAPPEQYGKAQTTPRSDIYSLGVVLHQLLSGHDPTSTPFRFPALSSLVPGVPPALGALVAHMLDLDEERRPASVALVKQELQALGTSAGSSPASHLGVPIAVPSTAQVRTAPPPSTTPTVARPVTQVTLAPHLTTLSPVPPTQSKEQWVETGQQHFQAHHYREALGAYERAIRLDPNFAAAHKYKSLALYELSRYTEALTACERALLLSPDDLELYHCKADTLEALNRQEEALHVHEQAILLAPRDVYSYYRKADILEATGSREEALLVLEQAMRLAPRDTRGYYSRADALEALGRREEALLVLEQAIRLAPDEIHGYRTSAILLEVLDRNEEALQAREQVIRLDPDDAYNYYYKGSLQEKLGQPADALSSYEEALRHAPADDFLYQCKGAVLSKLDRHEEALAAYEEAIRLKPDSANAYRGKGDVLKHLGRAEEAEQAYARASQSGLI